MDTPVTPQPVFEWHKSTPLRRPRSDNEVNLPGKPRQALFSGLFQRKLAERYLEDFNLYIARLDKVMARENFLAVTAAYLQVAVEVALRMRRPDLVKDFEKERDEAILAARQSQKLKHYPKGSRARRKA